MFNLLPDTRTLVVICAFSCYDDPPDTEPSRKRLQPLERVEPTVQRLRGLFLTDEAIKAKIQTVVLLNQDDASLRSNLREIRNALRSDVNMLLFWSGHGSVPKGSFRMATRSTFDPIDYEDGLGLEEVMRQSGVAKVETWTMFLDACYAGEGISDIVKAAQDLMKNEDSQLSGFGALCSCSPYEKARDSIFLETVVSVLENGPSEAAKNFAEKSGGGGSFNPNNRRLTIGELFVAMSTEYRADPTKFRGMKPWPILGGDQSSWLIPNPQYRPNQPSRLVEEAYRCIARGPDLENHFFPKALGIDNLESGWHFSGRAEATRSILEWMSTPPLTPEDRLYVLTGDGGTGKSALLGRLIALSDPSYRARAKEQGWNEEHDIKARTVPMPNLIDAALSLRNLTPQTVAEHLASLLAVGSFESVEDFVKKAVNSYERSDSSAPCLILDALDEATEPLPIVFRIIRPLVEADWKLLVATRRSASTKGARDLFADLGSSTVFQLDKDQQSWNDIFAYVRGRLQPDSRLVKLAEPAAHLIADRADNKFLFARIATSSLLRRAAVISLEQLPHLIAKDATDALTLEFEALDQAFRLQFGSDGNGATAMLTALAWAAGDGIPMRDGIWAAMAEAVGSLKGPPLRYEDHHIVWLLKEAGRFIQESGDGEQAVYRLFHKSLVDHFIYGPSLKRPLLEGLDERIAIALVAKVRASRDWAHTNPYLVRHMPSHLAIRQQQKGLSELLLNVEWIQARLNDSGIQALLSDYRLCHSFSPATARLHRTLSMIAHILRDHPDQLVPQLLGRIRPDMPGIAEKLHDTPSASFGLGPQGWERVDCTHSPVALTPDMNIESRSLNFTLKNLSLDSLLESVSTLLRAPRWVPVPGDLLEAGPLVSTLLGHEDRVTCVALSGDGRTLASGSGDWTVRLWSPQTCQPLHVLQGHKDWVTSVTLSADGCTLASASLDRTVLIWDTHTGQALRTLRGHDHGVTSVALSSDGSTLASASEDSTVRLWDVRTGQALRTLRGHDSRVTSVALSADGRTLASASDDRTVRLWNVQTGQPQRTLQGHEDWVTGVALSADGQILASAGDDHTVRLWAVQTGQLMHTLYGHEARITSVALSADGGTLASACVDRTVRLWDAQSSRPLHILQGHDKEVTSVALSADGRTLASASVDRTVRLWDAQTDLPVQHPPGHKDAATSIALSPDGHTFASGKGDGVILVRNTKTGQQLCTLPGHKSIVLSLALSADGHTLASASHDHTVRLWDTQTNHALRVMSGHEDRVNGVALSDDGGTLASGSHDRTVRLWDARTGRLLHTLLGHEDLVHSVALSADGRTLASASQDRTVRLWDTQTGQLLHTLQGHKSSVTNVSLSNDGQILASASRDHTVRLWDAQTGQLLHTLQDHRNSVTSVSLSYDGQTLASASLDGTLRFWDVPSGRCTETFTMDGAATALAWADQGTPPVLLIATGSTLVRFQHWLVSASR